nr:thiamine diphosphokinase [Deinobacterium chartae]
MVGGELSVTPELRARLEAHPPALVVAADGGVRHAHALGRRVDLWVGDFDSSDPADADFAGVERVSVPPEKDFVDSELALEQARSRGCDAALLLGALGGRFDHTLALALIALRWSAQGFAVSLHSGFESVWPLLPGRPLELELAPGATLSLLATEDLVDLDLEGVRWPLRGVRLEVGVGWGVSNRATGKKVRARCAQGQGLLIVQHQPV